jgi:uncharacterized membrane protein YkvA (DUF1232 family)
MRKILRATALAGLLRSVSRNAQRTLRDPEKMQKLASDASRHAAAAEGRGGIIAATVAPIRLMGRMLRAYATREYREVPWATMAAIGAALIYFVMPFDFVPDILAGFGLVDDMALVAFVLGKVAEDLADFSQWDMARRDGGNVVDSVAQPVAQEAEPETTQENGTPNLAESEEAIEAILDAIVGEKKGKKA